MDDAKKKIVLEQYKYLRKVSFQICVTNYNTYGRKVFQKARKNN